jgi:hypothetical protein
MRINKSIQSKQIGYIVILTFLTAINFINASLLPGHTFLLLEILCILFPVLFFLSKSEYKKILFFFSVSFFIYIIFIALSFRKFRDIFSTKPQSGSDLLGFPQYSGYPLYLDTVIFFAVILFPVVFFVLLKLLTKYRYLKNKK